MTFVESDPYLKLGQIEFSIRRLKRSLRQRKPRSGNWAGTATVVFKQILIDRCPGNDGVVQLSNLDCPQIAKLRSSADRMEVADSNGESLLLNIASLRFHA